jgi:hypothetical protein
VLLSRVALTGPTTSREERLVPSWNLRPRHRNQPHRVSHCESQLEQLSVMIIDRVGCENIFRGQQRDHHWVSPTKSRAPFWKDDSLSGPALFLASR